MINWKELEKFITPGKVCTLVILVDGKEIGAFSFNIDTLAYKEILETTAEAPFKIADKEVVILPTKKPDKTVYAQAAGRGKRSTGTTAAQKSFDDKADKALGMNRGTPEPEPLDDEPETEEDDNEEERNVDETTGEILEEAQVESVEEVAGMQQQSAGSQIDDGEPVKRLTREQVMMGGTAAEEFPVKKEPDPVKPVEVKKEEQKVVDQTFGEEW